MKQCTIINKNNIHAHVFFMMRMVLGGKGGALSEKMFSNGHGQSIRNNPFVCYATYVLLDLFLNILIKNVLSDNIVNIY